MDLGQANGKTMKRVLVAILVALLPSSAALAEDYTVNFAIPMITGA
jgi:hypothetical protein